MTYDYIIVGGGSAGSVMANRLSAKSANRVLLCEAGQDTPHGKVPPEILDSYPGTAYFDPRYHWTELKVHTEVISHNRPEENRPPLRKYEQARVMGGGSSINGQLANRGAPSDYDEWEARGAAGWSWNAVLPYFKKVERDMDFDGPWHGKDGRIPVRRIFPDMWNGHAKAVAKAFEEAGFEFVLDQNGEYKDGYFPITISNLYDRRVSAAIGYLDPGTRLRENLTISPQTQVTGLLFEGTRCAGVRALVAGKETEFRVGEAHGEVIVSSGAIHSPAHLLRAGIGPAGHLRDLGIEVTANLPGVGQRLMDHPSCSVSSFIKPDSRLNGMTRRHILLALRYSSGIGDAPPGDMFVASVSKSAWHAVGEQIGSLLAAVYKTFSETGQVRLASRDWRAEPVVEFNLLSDRRDLERLMDAFRRLGAMQISAALAEATSDPFPASYTERVRKIGVVNAKNKRITNVIAKLLDGPAWLRRYVIEKVIVEGYRFDQLMQDDEALEDFIRTAAIGVWHATCTCRMGAEDDPMAVTDNEGRVRGVAGLRVVDASLFPCVPCANTNFPTLMTAEKIADAIVAQ
ncbi:MAG TPA: GMC family oxidoreductase N-terminal domain-containing protein [Stellaceae bacterium]|jgi:5-(hydroxymethyl)furfural/furfural oxidase|nr:GMC family oxidoreductase N-terminal domain-containing protein [Stellaceae bacterium]